MLWIIFALGAALSWGCMDRRCIAGQVELGSPMRALLCVGVAYFLIGVWFPWPRSVIRASSMASP